MVLPFKPFKFLINLLWASSIQARQAYVERLKTVLDYHLVMAAIYHPSLFSSCTSRSVGTLDRLESIHWSGPWANDSHRDVHHTHLVMYVTV